MCCTKNWHEFVFIKIHFSIISHINLGLPCAPLFFSSTKTLYISVLSHTCYMPHPSQSSWVDHLNNIWWGVQSRSSLYCNFVQFCYLNPLGPSYLSQPEHHQPMSSFTPVQINRKNYSPSCFNILYFWTANRKTKDSEVHGSSRHSQS